MRRALVAQVLFFPPFALLKDRKRENRREKQKKKEDSGSCGRGRKERCRRVYRSRTPNSAGARQGGNCGRSRSKGKRKKRGENRTGTKTPKASRSLFQTRTHRTLANRAQMATATDRDVSRCANVSYGGGGAQPRHELAIACLFRNSAFFLREWIEHYLLMGATRFYLCDNLSEDDGREVLRPYVESGVVVLTRCDREFVSQFESEIHTPFFDVVLRAAAGEARWVACMDSDEFVAPVRADDRDLLTVLRRYEDEPVVYAHWQLYGTSGVERVPAGRLLCETFVRRGHAHGAGNRLLKAFVQTDRYIDMQDVHTIRGIGGFGRVAGGIRRAVTIPEEVCVTELRVNHYNTGDAAYYARYKVPFYERFVPLDHPGRQELLTRATRMAHCEVEDRSAAERFAPAIRRNVLGPRVCVIVHIDHVDQWASLSRPYLHNLRRSGLSYDMYVTVPRDCWGQTLGDAIRSFHMDCGTVAPGRGERAVEFVFVNDRDTHTEAWLLALRRIAQLNRAYDYALKFHATLEPSRHAQLAQAIVGTSARVRECIDIMDRDPTVGMIGAAPWVCDQPDGVRTDALNRSLGASIDSPGRFVDGSVFWVRYEPMAQASATVTDLDALAAQCHAGHMQSQGAADLLPAECALGNSIAHAGLEIRGASPVTPELVGQDEIDAIEAANAVRISARCSMDPLTTAPSAWDPVGSRAIRSGFEAATAPGATTTLLAAAVYAEARDALHVTELTRRCGLVSWASARALLHSLMVPCGRAEAAMTTVRRLVTVDMERSDTRTLVADACASTGISVETRTGDTAQTTIEETDVLIIDSWRVCAHLRRELAHHSDKVRRCIIIAGTAIDGDRGETVRRNGDPTTEARRFAYKVDEVRKGVWPAIRDLVATSESEWGIVRCNTEHDGFVVIVRKSLSPSARFIPLVCCIEASAAAVATAAASGPPRGTHVGRRSHWPRVGAATILL